MKKEVSEYFILSSESEENLIEYVNIYISEGWEVTGGVATVPYERTGGMQGMPVRMQEVKFYQAMVKYK